MFGALRRVQMRDTLRIAVTALVCAMLAWGVITTGLGAEAVRQHNARMLVVFASRHQPDVATELASQRFDAKHDGDAMRLARAAVVAAPLNVNALTILGLALERTGRNDEANTILRRAALMGWRSPMTLLWGLKDAVLNDKPDRVLAITDALARQQQVGTVTRLIFFQSLSDPALRPYFVQSLAARPSWRSGFFADVHDSLATAQFDGMDAVFRQLDATKGPATPYEKLIYIDRMVRLGAIDRAHLYWARNFAIPTSSLAASPFDGRFARAATKDRSMTSPFEWQFNPNIDDTIAWITAPKEGLPALQIGSAVPQGVAVVSQIIFLRPGPHYLQTSLIAGMGGTAPVGWSITCLPSNQPLLRRIEGKQGDELSRISIAVPAQGCSAQSLQLVGLDRVDPQPVSITSVVIQ